jgi:NTE family protein
VSDTTLPLPRTAFVLAGGGSLGAVQVGMLKALAAAGVEPDLLVGTSAGALNAVWVAGHGMSAPALAELGRLWVRLQRRDVFPLHLSRLAQGMVGRSQALSSSDALAALVEVHAGFSDLADAGVETHLVTTDLLSGQAVLLSSGPLVPAVLASAAVPGLYPPVALGGHHLVDGGVAQHSGIRYAVALGATTVWVLPTGYPCALARPPRTAAGVALQALSLLTQQRLADEVATWSARVTVKVMPPLCPLAVSPADFTHARELIERATRATAAWLERGADELPAQERFLGLHRHGTGDRTTDGVADPAATRWVELQA